MHSLSIVIAIAMLTKTINVLINPADAFMDQYIWTSAVGDCKNTTTMGIFCVANVSVAVYPSCASYAIVLADYADLRGIEVDPGANLTLAYNYTGPDWILKVGTMK